MSNTSELTFVQPTMTRYGMTTYLLLQYSVNKDFIEIHHRFIFYQHRYVLFSDWIFTH